MELTVLICCFFFLMIIGLPIAYNLIISCLAYLLVSNLPIILIVQRMYEGMSSFSFLGCPVLCFDRAVYAEGQAAGSAD